MTAQAVRPLEDVERQLVIPEDIAPAASTRYISPKDANDALRQPVPHLIPLMLSAAKLLPNEKVLSFADLRAEAINGLTQTEPEGVHVTSLPHLSSITKGLRRGELVVFTGPTGGGKTTILSQMSLDVARKGVPVLWGSFEIRNSRLVQKVALTLTLILVQQSSSSSSSYHICFRAKHCLFRCCSNT